MANQNSIISYVPQPFYIESSACSVDPYGNATLENSTGLLDPDLSNYTTVVPDASEQQFGVETRYAKIVAHLVNTDMTVALIGCSMLTYEDDGGGNPDLETEFSEDISCTVYTDIGSNAAPKFSYAHNSQDKIKTLFGVPMPGIISGGTVNLIYTGIGTPDNDSEDVIGVIFTRTPTNTAARPHARAIIGHVFIGVNIPIIIDPRSFSWTIESQNRRFTARDTGTISSEGTLVRQASGEIIKIPNNDLHGSVVTETSPEIVSSVIPNFFDLAKVNNSYPVLLNPYPVDAPEFDEAGFTPANLNLTARQNFFSIYGFMDGPLEFQVGEYRDGLDSEYRARFRIKETR